MSSFSVCLYFSKSVGREEMRRRITALPECRPDPEEPGMYWAGQVHISLGDVGQEYKVTEIRHTVGLEVGDFYVNLTVFGGDEEGFFEKWDRALDLLAYGEDAVAIRESAFVMLVQKNGKLTLDSSGKGMSDFYREYVLTKHQAELAPFGQLEGVD